MVQSLDVISVNLWNIIISLANLTILFLLVKKFLFQPVKKVMQKRRSEIDNKYQMADEKEREASMNKDAWEKKIKSAQSEADEILSDAVESARSRGDKIILDAKMRAEVIVRQAESDAKLEYKKAHDDIKNEIVQVSEALAEKMLEREINTDDHRNLIDSYIEKIGDSND